jgi:glutamyl-tRNA synthetase
MVRVRFAPSPTGFLHIGGLRTALYNELFARRHKGVLVLRIEDTDRTRYVEGAVESLLRTLEWAGIRPDEGPYLDGNDIKQRGAYGPYIQSERLAIYRKHADDLLKSGKAYRCFCSAETLEDMKKTQAASGRPVMYDRRCRSLKPEEVESRLATGAPHVVRLKVPETGRTEFNDAVRGKVSFENGLIDDQVLVKSDGYPTYHLANVVDDHLMEITHVIRGEEWLPSTPKHILLYGAFGWSAPVFGHIPLLLNPDRSKLSKRQGDVAAEDYRKQGYLPEAIVNFVALLGWNPSADREIYSKDELVGQFDLAKVNRSGAVFNRAKLDWLNREYLKKLSDDKLLDLARPFLSNLAGAGRDEARLRRSLALERPRITVLSDLADGTDFYFGGDLPYDAAELPGKKSTAEVAVDRLSGIIEALEKEPDATYDDPKAVERSVMAYMADKGWTNAETLWPMRYALTGKQASPGPFEMVWCLGREESLRRLKLGIGRLKK